MSYVYKMMNSPVGTLKLVGSEAGLAAILWEDDDPKRVRIEVTSEDEHYPVLVEAERRVNEYLAGGRWAFTIKLDYRGTPFQKKVWQALLDIPFGETRTYGELAKQIGSPRAVRAVGAANGKAHDGFRGGGPVAAPNRPLWPDISSPRHDPSSRPRGVARW